MIVCLKSDSPKPNDQKVLSLNHDPQQLVNENKRDKINFHRKFECYN